MVFKKMFSRNNGIDQFEPEEYVELDALEEGEEQRVKIRVATLNELRDVEHVQNLIRDGSIVWVKLRPLKNKDMTELKRAIDRLKKTVASVEGDIAGVDEDWLIATPKYAHIHR